MHKTRWAENESPVHRICNIIMQICHSGTTALQLGGRNSHKRLKLRCNLHGRAAGQLNWDMLQIWWWWWWWVEGVVKWNGSIACAWRITSTDGTGLIARNRTALQHSNNSLSIMIETVRKFCIFDSPHVTRRFDWVNTSNRCTCEEEEKN